MDLLPIAFLLVFVLLSGVIAVLADEVGRKMGKKRLSIWKLRPKHTAKLGTFLMGVVISLFTIILVSVVSSDVRRWIREGASAIEQRNQAVRDLQGVRKDLAAQDAHNKDLDKEIKAKTAQLSDQAKRLTSMRAEIKKLQPEIARLQNAVTAGDKRIKLLDRERAETQKELSAKQAQLAKMQDDLKKVRADLVAVRRERAMQEKLAQAAAKDASDTSRRNLDLTIQNGELETGIAKLREDIRQLGQDKKELEVARDKAKDELEGAKEQLGETQARLSSTQADLAEVNRQLGEAKLAVTFFIGISNQTREQPMMYGIGEEVARLPLEGAMSVAQAQDALASLLRSARIEATDRGAKRNGDYPEAGIFEHKDVRTNEPITPEMIERQITQRMAGSRGPIVLVASSSQNSFRGEPVSLEIEVLPNPVVYNKGQVIAETRIDGHKGEEVILKQLEDFLRTRIRERAKADKMISRRGSDQLGEIAPGDIYRLLNQVKAADRQVRVQALAMVDTRAGDPLRLDFRIR